MFFISNISIISEADVQRQTISLIFFVQLDYFCIACLILSSCMLKYKLCLEKVS